MSNAISDQIRVILQSFIGDPPDNDFQQGYLAAALVIANEVVGISRTDPLWRQADAILSGWRPDRRSLKLVATRPMPSPHQTE